METTTASAWVGIDVSKHKLDACLVHQKGIERHKSFANTPPGFAKLIAWTQGLAPEGLCHFALEATACYSEAVALFLSEQGQKVSVLNPARVHYAALASGVGNRTDPSDARAIAHFCRKGRCASAP